MNLIDIIIELDTLSIVQSIQKDINGTIGHILQGTLSVLSVFHS